MRRSVVRGTSDPKLTPLQDAIEKAERTDPRDAPELRGHSVATRDELRGLRGSADGNAGPRATILIGNSSPKDGGEGVFVWDPTSVAADDGTNILQPMNDEQGRWRRVLTPPVQSAAVIAVSVITSGSGSWPAASGVRRAWARIWGGGGGGGGVAAAGGNPFVTMGGGGGAGSSAEFWTTTIPVSYPFTIGAAGSAGTSGGGTGGNGGSTTFGDGVSTITVPGGSGGIGNATGSSALNITAGGAGGTLPTGGAQMGGRGQGGAYGIHVNTTQAASGAGGSTNAAAGGEALTASGAGNAGGQPGGGGSGALDVATNAAAAGGAGGAGMIVLVEFG